MKALFTALILVMLSESIYAQYDKGDVNINAGLSVGLIGYGYGYYGAASGFVPLYANLEFSINNRWSFGPYLGYYARSYGNGDFRFTALSFGARGTFHGSEFINEKLNASINVEKVDIYAALHLGLELLSWRYPNDIADGFYSNSNRLIFGPVIGIRYMFSPGFGAFLETGRGAFGLATIGVTLKL